VFLVVLVSADAPLGGGGGGVLRWVCGIYTVKSESS
jgi:hypothetical protein